MVQTCGWWPKYVFSKFSLERMYAGIYPRREELETTILWTSRGPSFLVRLKMTISYLSSNRSISCHVAPGNVGLNSGRRQALLTGFSVFILQFHFFTPFTCKISHKVCFQPFPYQNARTEKLWCEAYFDIEPGNKIRTSPIDLARWAGLRDLRSNTIALDHPCGWWWWWSWSNDNFYCWRWWWCDQSRLLTPIWPDQTPIWSLTRPDQTPIWSDHPQCGSHIDDINGEMC